VSNSGEGATEYRRARKIAPELHRKGKQMDYTSEQAKAIMQGVGKALCETIFADQPEELKAEFLKNIEKTEFVKMGEPTERRTT